MTAPRRTTGLQIARVAGVPVRLMPSWFVFAAYLVLTGQATLREQYTPGTATALASAFTLLLLASVVLHEIGHCLAARAFGLPVSAIRITLIAGFTEINEAPQTPAREYAVAISGPLVSLLLCSTGLVGAATAPADSVASLLLYAVAVSNGAICVLNLLPGLPLDGGRVLRSIVWHVTDDGALATRFSARSGMLLGLVGIPLLVIGVLPALGIGDRDGSTFLVAALIGAFVYVGASATLRHSDMVSRLPSLSVERFARPALGVTASTPLSEAVRRANEAAVHALLVVDGAGEVDGIVSESWVKAVPQERRPWVAVADGARRMEPGLLLDPALSGEALLEAMSSHPAAEYVVGGPTPRVLVSADVAKAMSASRSPIRSSVRTRRAGA